MPQQGCKERRRTSGEPFLNQMTKSMIFFGFIVNRKGLHKAQQKTVYLFFLFSQTNDTNYLHKLSWIQKRMRARETAQKKVREAIHTSY